MSSTVSFLYRLASGLKSAILKFTRFEGVYKVYISHFRGTGQVTHQIELKVNEILSSTLYSLKDELPDGSLNNLSR